MKDLVRQLRNIWSGAAPAQRAAAIAGLLLLTCGLGAGVFFATRPDFALLFGNLDESEAAGIVDAVRSAGVEAEVRQNGHAVYVPRSSVAEMRMLVSKDGVPGGSSKGFELFDRSAFGVSDFEQNVKFLRAIQGELAKSITGFSAVEAARVAITRPRRSPFVGQDQPAKASVVVRIRSGRSLSRENVRAIVNLVTGAVEGLESRNVSVMDQEMRVLSDVESDALAAQVNQQFDLRQREEEYLTRMAQAQLDRVGVRADVRVACELDFQNMHETSEQYSSEDRALVHEENESKNVKGSTTHGGGPAGVKSQIGDNAVSSAGEASEETEESGRSRYLPSRTVRSEQQTGARVKRLSVSLVLHQEHASEKLVIEDMVKRAVGFDDNRADTITTVVREFASADEAALPPEEFESPLLPMLLERGVQVLGILGALFLLLKIVKSAEHRGPARVGAGVPAGRETALSVAHRDDPRIDPGAGMDAPNVRNRILSSVQQNPQVATRVLREWLRDGSGNG